MQENAKFSKRLTAYLLDIIFVYLIVSLVVNIRFINPNYDKYMDAYTEYSELLEESMESEDITELMNTSSKAFYDISKYGVSYNIATALILFLYFGVFQKYNNGQTLGKKIMKIKVVGINEEKVSLGKFCLRLLPLQYIYVGSVIPLIVNSILVYLFQPHKYLLAYSGVTYLFLIINIVSFILLLTRKDKRGLHDLLSGTKVILE